MGERERLPGVVARLDDAQNQERARAASSSAGSALAFDERHATKRSPSRASPESMASTSLSERIEAITV